MALEDKDLFSAIFNKYSDQPIEFVMEQYEKAKNINLEIERRQSLRGYVDITPPSIPQNTGEVNSSRHCTFIGADNHQVIVVCSEIGHMSQKRFQKLISREEIVKPFQWNGILHSWVVSVKGNDIGDSHITELFQC